MLDQVYTLHSNGIQTDMLGQPIQVGDVVLAKSDGSSDKNTFGVVERVNRKTVGVRLRCRYYTHDKYHSRPDGHQGYWNYYPNGRWVDEELYIKRSGHATLEVSQEFMDTAQSRLETVVNQHPEIFI